MYPEGMLDRDQRTAKIPLNRNKFSDNFVPNLNRTNSISYKASSMHSNSIITSIVKRKTTKFSFFIWKRGYSLPKLPRLKNVLLVIVYLMLTILPTTHSAPSTMNSPRKFCTAKWLRNCLTEINIANAYAESDKNNFAEYPNWVNDPSTPSWLPRIGKKVNEDLSEADLSDLTVEGTLPIIYSNFQKIAVILEEVVKELEEKPLQKYFVSLQDHNSPILEVLKQVIKSMGIRVPLGSPIPPGGALPPDVVQAFRAGDMTKTSAFATIIFRECINNYQFAAQALSHLLNQLDPDQNGC